MTDSARDTTLQMDEPPGDVVVRPAAAPARRQTRAHWLRGRTWRAAVVALVVGLVAIYVLDGVVGGVMFRARQGQLAADIRAPRPYTQRGRAVAVLQIPTLDVNLVVAEGVAAGTLRGGPGHLATSAMPGASGNAVVYGHRQRFGAPFNGLTTLRKGDSIFVRPKGTDEVVKYIVDDVRRGTDASIGFLSPQDGVHLTLVTSSGGPLSADHVVVSATANAPVTRPPQATKAPVAPTSFEPRSGLVSRGFLLALGWLIVGMLVVFGLRRGYPTVVVVAASIAPLVLAAALLWLEVDRWLPATL
jgi:sortase A